jgi:hypothetical protein
MLIDQKRKLLNTFVDNIQLPYSKGIKNWCEENIILPNGYAIPGKLDLSTSPYLHQPLADLDDPTIKQVNFIMATQLGKSLCEQMAIGFFAVNAPAPMLYLLHNNDIAKKFAKSHIIPLLRNCKLTNNLLNQNRFATTVNEITFANGITCTIGGANEGFAHGLTIRYLLLDEVHQWDNGILDKVIARTTAFAGRRKIVISSQPNEKGSELERHYLQGRIMEWQWKCPKCGAYQPYEWAKERADGTWAGFNWDTILMPDGETTNIAQSAKTCWLECDPCRHKIYDTPSNRVLLNNTGKYVCIKNDGAGDVVSYTAPNFVNINLSYESAAAQYMLAKRVKRTGVDEQMKIFVNQVLGKFYKAEEIITDTSTVLCENYAKEITGDWLCTMGVDVQKKGGIKYWGIRSWNKNGLESRRIDFGIARTWEEIGAIQNKYKILTPLVGVDSGFDTQEVYQATIVAAGNYKIIKNNNGQLEHVGWIPFKGEGTHKGFVHKDGITRLYSMPSLQSVSFADNKKFAGIPAKLILYQSTQIQSILANLRDNKIAGVKWLIDSDDKDYLQQIYAEGFADIVNKKTGLTETRWIEKSDNNHYFDVEKINLVIAIMAKYFTLADNVSIVTPQLAPPSNT